ncbi:TetR family transcriptional regulator [Hydrogenispora ethanolica]|jgi:AcrR family transcriptional regulator|uniref:TetR family transcriptional regulator n=1 Tax=Hydrogenispora ethanolica TaxID=1082276 RepID=A0A4R1SA05_HYDET|nr:TetR/AcrR family transcriptional regulator [Hydrogenispora ethanolica]TCL76258.1 TetR family transcriptional regulator [Hydrogenispora ethanolica]
MGTMDRKEKVRQLRQEDIINAAEQVFFAKGFAGATMDDIAKEAQYSKRTIYVYFSSKDQLYDAVILRGYRILNRMYEAAFGDNTPANGLEKALRMGRTYLEFIERHPQYFEAIALYATRAEDLDSRDEWKAANYREGNIGADMLIDCIRQGIADGSIAPDLDPVDTAFVLYAQILGIGQILLKKEAYIAQTYRKNPSQLVEELFKLVVKGLKPEEG